LSFPPHIQFRVNSGESSGNLGHTTDTPGFPASSAEKALLEFIPMEIGAGMTGKR
jgi:hypothetical protein